MSLTLKRKQSKRRVKKLHRTLSRGFQSLESRRLLAGLAGSDPFVVSTLVDEDDGDHSAGDLSLREAIGLLVSSGSDDGIVFDDALRGGTIQLTGGELVIDDNVLICGPTDGEVTIDAGGQSRHFRIEESVTAIIIGITLTGGSRPTEDTGGDGNDGGSILNRGTLELEDVTLAGNTAQRGGAIASSGTLTIRASAIGGNLANEGGAVDASGPLTVRDTTFKENVATEGDGGAILAEQRLIVSGSTFVNNSAHGIGGGVAALGANHDNAIINSTLYGNTAGGSGGAIATVVAGSVAEVIRPVTTITNSTIVGNAAGLNAAIASTFAGGGVSINSQSPNNGQLAINNTILADNIYAPTNVRSEIAYAFESSPREDRLVGRNNLIGDEASSAEFEDGVDGHIVGNNGLGMIDLATVLFDANGDGAISDIDLLDFSGPTKTFAPAWDSPVVDAGDNSVALDESGSPLILDQRQQPRTRDGDLDATARIDIGAYEDPTPIVVNTILDFVDPLDNLITLREAMGSLSQISSGDDRIRFADPLAGNTITLNGSELVMEGQMFIDATNLQSFTLDADGDSRILLTDSDDVLTIAGLTLTGGNQTESAADAGGSAIRNAGRLNVVQSRITDGTASGTNAAGAIFNAPRGSVHVLSSQIDNNHDGGLGGAGFFNQGLASIVDTRIESNVATEGGGIYNDGGTLLVSASQITGNSATGGSGAGIFSQNGRLRVEESNVDDNTATDSGGGLFSQSDSLAVWKSDFSGNQARRGGGIAGDGSTISIAESNFISNDAVNGGQAFGGAIDVNQGTAVIRHSTLDSNSASQGGGLRVDAATVDVEGSTISANNATESGGGIYNVGGDIDIVNSTISGNTAARFGGGIRTGEGPLSLVNSTLALNHGDADGLAGDTGGGIYVETNIVFFGNTLIAANRRGTTPVPDDIGFSEFELSQVNLDITADHTLVTDADTAFDLVDGQAGNIIGISGTLDSQADMLGTLRDRGGPTKTHGHFGPTGDAGRDDLATNRVGDPLNFDQRGEGYRRIIGAQVDIGAYEHGPFQNRAQPLDTNLDLKVSALDALLVINFLAIAGVDDGGPVPQANDLLLDVDGSDVISSLDALIIINRLSVPLPALTARLVFDRATGGRQNLDFFTNSYALEFGASGGTGGEQLELRIDGAGGFTNVGDLAGDIVLRLEEVDLDAIAGAALADGDHRFEVRIAGETEVHEFLITIDREFFERTAALDQLFADRAFEALLFSV